MTTPRQGQIENGIDLLENVHAHILCATPRDAHEYDAHIMAMRLLDQLQCELEYEYKSTKG